MSRRVLLTLAALTLLNGCAGPQLDRPLAEFRPGAEPGVAEVRYDATHDLVRTDAPAVLYSTKLVRGERAGFRAEDDGTVVAVVRGRAIPLGDGEYAWVVPPGGRPGWLDRWRDRLAVDGRDVREFARGTAVVAGITLAWAAGTALFLFAYGYGGGRTRL